MSAFLERYDVLFLSTTNYQFLPIEVDKENMKTDDMKTREQFKDMIKTYEPIINEKVQNDFYETNKRKLEETIKQFEQGVKIMKQQKDEEDSIKDYTKTRKNMIKLYTMCQNICSQFEIEVKQEVTEEIENMKRELEEERAKKEIDEQTALIEFEEEATREFYRDIPDIRELIENTKSYEEMGKKASKDLMDKLIEELPKRGSKAGIEEWVKKLGNLIHKKEYRNRLATSMLYVNRVRLDLLSHYSRLAAIIYPLYKDVAQQLSQGALLEFQKFFRGKDQIKIESKLKYTCYLAELAKFKLVTLNDIMNLWRECLDDFAFHSIDVACSLIDRIGRYLYLNIRYKKLVKDNLDEMMRYRDVKHFDVKYNYMIQNAVYICKTPAVIDTQEDHGMDLPIMQKYIYYLLYENLVSNEGLNKVYKCFQKLDWADEQTRHFVLEAFSSLHLAKYSDLPFLACFLSVLSSSYDFIVIRVIERLLERIRSSLLNEIDISNRRRLLDVKFLGELYVYKVLDHPIILQVLYWFIFYAPQTDSPTNFMRVRCMVTLLEVVGDYFISRSQNTQLDRFILYFQNYLLKKGVRMDVLLELELASVLDNLRPNLIWPHDVDASNEQIQKSASRRRRVQLPQADRLFPIEIDENDDDDDSDSDDEDYLTYDNLRQKKIDEEMQKQRILNEHRLKRELDQYVLYLQEQRNSKKLLGGSTTSKSTK
eukprot:CAMPEP_0117420794 /NCGR_PEP_ID=MMETSP0758-20121206/2056_1 /TAXON_ID=63605 /ORGANISM="Percolomonas cosmopolitus, Strain AE-1 (ATCC 50343)" /LENGTH=707 /DNA_ID=CAMNT_0005202615 /DNA_START=691 /DNA_END=2811 /DNA_ORIENTATION=+